MSLTVMAEVFKLGPEVTPTQRLLLLAIADNADDDGYAFPGISYVARKVGMSERTVQRAKQELIEAGLIEVVSTDDIPGEVLARYEWLPSNRRPHVIHLTLRGDTVSPQADSGVTSVRSGVTPEVDRGDTAVTQTVKNRNRTAGEVVHRQGSDVDNDSRFSKGSGIIDYYYAPDHQVEDAVPMPEELRQRRQRRKDALG